MGNGPSVAHAERAMVGTALPRLCPPYGSRRLVGPLQADAAAKDIVAIALAESNAEPARDRDPVALGHEIVAEHAHERHAECVGILEIAPIRRHAEALVAGEIGICDGHGERHTRLVLINSLEIVVELIEERSAVGGEIAVGVRGDDL